MKAKQMSLKSAIKILSIMVLLIFLGCSKEEAAISDPADPDPIGQEGPDPNNSNELTISEVLSRAVVEDFPEAREADTLAVLNTSYDKYQEPGDDGSDIDYTYRCTTKKMSVLDGNDKFPLFNPNAEVIWPGNLLQGNSLDKSTPATINVDRAGGTVSYNLITGNTVSASSVDEVTKSKMQIAMNEIIANDPNIVPANFQLEVEEVFSEEQMALEIGMSYESYTIKASGNLSFSSDKIYNRVLVKLTQQYYTMSMDQVNGLDDIFASDVTGKDLDPYVQTNNPATFISSVTYGRIFYMLVESTSSINELKARVEGTYRGFDKKIEGEVDYEQYNSLKEVRTKIIAYGGSAESAFELTGELDINTIGEKLAESTNIKEGLPLSYVVRSVENPSKIVGTKLATEYDRVECELWSKGSAPIQTKHWEGEVVSRMGPVGAAFCVEGTEFVLISRDGKQYMRSINATLEGPFPIEDLYEGEYPFGDDGIGAACNISLTSSSNNTIMFMSQSGLFYNYVLDGKTWRTNINPIENLAAGDNPFAGDGIGAMAFRSYSGGPSDRWMFTQDGNEYTYYSNNPNEFEPKKELWQWGKDNTVPFESVGAAIGFYLGNNRQYILFNKAGTQYVHANAASDWASEGPYGL